MTTFNDISLNIEEEIILLESAVQYEKYLYSEIQKAEDNLAIFPDDDETRKQLEVLNAKFEKVKNLVLKIQQD